MKIRLNIQRLQKLRSNKLIGLIAATKSDDERNIIELKKRRKIVTLVRNCRIAAHTTRSVLYHEWDELLFTLIDSSIQKSITLVDSLYKYDGFGQADKMRYSFVM